MTQQQNPEQIIEKIQSRQFNKKSVQNSLYILWLELERNLISFEEKSALQLGQFDKFDREKDEITDGQDLVANAMIHSSAETCEDLLYKLAIWKSDLSGAENELIDADRKDHIVYSVFQDLVRITGLADVDSHPEKATGT